MCEVRTKNQDESGGGVSPEKRPFMSGGSNHSAKDNRGGAGT